MLYLPPDPCSLCVACPAGSACSLCPFGFLPSVL
jgi:hypothetical protein